MHKVNEIISEVCTYIIILFILLLQRDDYRRFQHNLIERARREKINNWIIQLGKIIDDDNSDDDNTNSNNNHAASKNGGEALSKSGILEKVCNLLVLSFN